MASAARPWLHACALAIALLVTAHVSARADVLVLDSCMKQCGDEDLRALGNIRYVLEVELKRPGLIASVQDVRAHLGGNVPLPSADDPYLTSAALTKDLKDGISRWAGGDHKEAAQLLQAALAKAAENPAVVVSDPTLRQLVPRAYVGWAVSLLRLNRISEAKEAIAELVRTTPEPSILDSWGTEADKIFQLSRKDLVARGMGSLTIQVDDPTAVFYLDAAGQPHKAMFAAELLPGIYRIFVIDTLGRSRRYWVEVVPHGHATLNIDWHRDLEFEATSMQQPRIGFTFPSFAERRLEGGYARRLAALVHSDFMVVIGRIKWDGHEAIIGVIYRAGTAAALRVGVVPSFGNVDSARDLVNFLFSPSLPAPHVISLAAPPWEVPPPAPSDVRLRWPAKWFVTGGAAAIAIGAGLYDRDPASHGIALGAVGVASLGVGIWWTFRNAHHPSAPTVSMGASHAVLGWMGTF